MFIKVNLDLKVYDNSDSELQLISTLLLKLKKFDKKTKTRLFLTIIIKSLLSLIIINFHYLFLLFKSHDLIQL